MKLIHPITITATDQPDLRPIANGTYELFGDFTVTFKMGGDVCTLRVPDGTTNDGASIPRWLWGPFGFRPDGLHRAAALSHDYLCRNKGRFVCQAFGECAPKVISSADTHALFGQLLVAAAVPTFRAKLMTTAVMVFGPRWGVK